MAIIIGRGASRHIMGGETIKRETERDNVIQSPTTKVEDKDNVMPPPEVIQSETQTDADQKREYKRKPTGRKRGRRSKKDE